jgi:hypothetical protein
VWRCYASIWLLESPTWRKAALIIQPDPTFESWSDHGDQIEDDTRRTLPPRDTTPR